MTDHEWRFNRKYWQRDGLTVECCGNCSGMKPDGNVINFYRGICSLTRKSVDYNSGTECKICEIREAKK